MTLTAHPELRQPTLICAVTPTSDAALKQFLAAAKNVFSPLLHFICPMKTAIDLAIRGKPPVIKPYPGDIMNLPGNLLSLVISNWLAAQLRKPPPKSPVKRGPVQRKNTKTAIQQEPPPPEPEVKGPFIVFIFDYPRTVEQFQEVLSQQAPIACHITIDGGVQQVERKSTPAANSSFGSDLKQALSSEITFATMKMTAETPVEQQIKELLQQLYSIYNGYIEFKKEFSDTCYITMPTYPPKPITIPLAMVDKPTKSRLTDAMKTMGNSASLMANSITTPQTPIFQTDALKNAYKSMILAEIDSYIKTSSFPCFSTSFQHYAEIFPKFPLPASLAQVLSVLPNFKANEIFLMRSAADRNNTSYDIIFRILMRKKFEEMIGYSVGERNRREFLTLEILPNVIAPLSEQFSEFKTAEFGGKLLLAFYHKIPENLPILNQVDKYTLPTYVGFGKWLESHTPFSSEAIDIDTPKDIGVNVGSSCLYMGMESDETFSNSSHYFCESGLRVVAYQPRVENGLLEDLHFHLSYCQNERFSFKLHQRSAPSTNEEEEEDIVETLTSIRGVLSKNAEFYFEHSNDCVRFIMVRKDSRVEFDVLNHAVIISGAENESHRVITPDGKLIRYTDHPIIYHTDGAIEQKIRGVWRMVDAEGNGYIKRGNKWFFEHKFDTTSDTISTYFTSRKVTNRSDGLSIIDDDGDITLVFPDGTRYNKNQKTYCHKKIPSIIIKEKEIIVDSKEFTANMDENLECSFALKNQECSITFNEELRHLLIQYGQLCNVMTMVDLFTGSIAHVGARRFVYYLSEEWKWILGRQLCSKKEILQHFQDGDFLERIQSVDNVGAEEIEAIICNGHKPRLFVVEKDFNDFSVFELLDDNVYKSIAEQSIDYSSKNNEQNQTLWFDTKPKSFREMKVMPKITPEMVSMVDEIIEKEKDIQKDRSHARVSAIDPKWRVIEAQQEKEEEEMKILYEKYGIDINENDNEPEVTLDIKNEYEEEEEECDQDV